MKKFLYFTFLLLCCTQALNAQDSSYVMRHIKLDSFVVSASKEYGFDIAQFIRRVEEDTTFYKAFKNLRILSYTAKNDIQIFNKKGKVKASLENKTRQHRKNHCRTMDVIKEKTTGNFYEKDSLYNYYTAELFADIFFTKGKICGENNLIHDSNSTKKPQTALERHKEQLKKLIFNPGKPISGVPLIGNKVAIFDDKNAPMYDFSIQSALYNATDCYVFEAHLKPEFENKGVINHLITYFSKENMEIVYRDYSLSYQSLLFHFNVNIKVNMTHFDGLMVPQRIDYDGDWKVIFKKEEKAVFSAIFSHFSESE